MKATYIRSYAHATSLGVKPFDSLTARLLSLPRSRRLLPSAGATASL